MINMEINLLNFSEDEFLNELDFLSEKEFLDWKIKHDQDLMQLNIKLNQSKDKYSQIYQTLIREENFSSMREGTNKR